MLTVLDTTVDKEHTSICQALSSGVMLSRLLAQAQDTSQYNEDL